jgi:hypothetical protein
VTGGVELPGSGLTGTFAGMAQRANTLDDALDVLELQPLDFLGGEQQSPARDPAFYVEPPPRDDESDGLPGPGPAERLRDQLLSQHRPAKLFLSGHVGSGKSTQINKLAADSAIRGAFSVVLVRIEAGLVPFLDAAQLLFLMAGNILDFGVREHLLSEGGRWKGIVRDLDARLHGDKGVVAKEGAVSAEFNLLFIKIREDLKLSEQRRRQFREIGETQQSLLLDLLNALTLDIETTLTDQGKHHSLLLLIDDLDKVRGPEQQKDIFNTNLGLLHVLPFRALYTVPTGVVFGPSRAEVRRALEHLYPVRVLDKAPDGFDPEKAFIPDSDAFFRKALDQRVAPSLFEDAAVRLAAIYSGGVLREFFRLLRSAVGIARHNKLDLVDVRALRAAIRDERRRDTMGLYASDYQALLAIHETHDMAKDEERRYLDEARVLECYNDKTWYEVNPLLWKVLKEG